jgi:Tol biopolymer transport system component
VYALPESPGDVGVLQATIIGSPGHVLLQDLESGKARTLFTIQAPASRIEITGPGRLIFDSLAQRSNLKLFSNTSATSSESRWLTRGNSIDRQPYFSPDGASVIFSSSRAGDVDLWEVTLKTASLRRLTDDPALDWDPFVTRDNQHLVWSSNRSGHFEIWIADRDGSSPRQLSHDGFDAENPVVTPDGWLVYVSGQPQHPGVWKMRLDGTDAKLLVPGSYAWPDVSPDGRYVIYHVVTDGLHAVIHIAHLADGTPVEFHAVGRRARFSSDGRSIVYIETAGPDIVAQGFLSPSSPVHVLVPAPPDFVAESFEIDPGNNSIVASYVQPSRSIVLADGIAAIAVPREPK